MKDHDRLRCSADKFSMLYTDCVNVSTSTYRIFNGIEILRDNTTILTTDFERRPTSSSRDSPEHHLCQPLLTESHSELDYIVMDDTTSTQSPGAELPCLKLIDFNGRLLSELLNGDLTRLRMWVDN